MLRLLSALGIMATVALGAPSQPVSGPFTAEELFHTSEIGEARFSPDGKHLGTLVADKKGLYNLLVFDMQDYKASGLRANGAFEVSNFQWLENDRVLFSVLRGKFYSMGLFSSRLSSFDHIQQLDKFDATRIVGIPRRHPGRVIIWITQSSLDEGRPGELLELDVNRARGDHYRPGAVDESVVASYEPPKAGPPVDWGCDRDGELATCTTWMGGAYHLFRYLAATKAWASVTLDPQSRPMAVDYDSNYLWVVRISPSKVYELCRVNMETGVADKPVLTDSTYDIGTGHLYFSDATRSLAGVAYMKRAPVSFWFVGVYASAQATLNHIRPGTYNVLANHDAADRKFLFKLGGPGHPYSYEILDLDSKTLRRVSAESALAADPRLCPVQPISFKTRDGVKLEGYQVLPPGASADHPVPLVVLVHGGPAARDTCEFDPTVQFLVSRGYAVLQPNYRGSIGYAPDVSRVGEFDFFRMHQDVTDATKAILGTGVIDKRRVAIMGASFGGYLAVSGVAFEDKLYRCAISECGVFDWARQIRSKKDVARPGEYEILTYELGKSDKELEHLDEISPIRHADKIHVPVLLAHGTDDNVVDVSQSKKLASELRRRGVPCETFYRSWEGHGFFDYDDRVAFYHRVEAFLAANLGGLSLTPPK